MPSLLDRRAVLLSLTMAAFFRPSKAFSLSKCSPYKDENIDGLINGFGFRVGPQDRRHDMVALVAPWCPICLSLLEDARQGILPYNLHAIPCEPANKGDDIRIAESCFAVDDDSTLGFHSRARLPKRTLSAEEVSFVNQVQKLTMEIVLDYAARFQSSVPNGFPIMYTAYPDGFWAASGYKRDVYLAGVKNNSSTNLSASFLTTNQLRNALKRIPKKRTYRLLNPNSRFRIFPSDHALTGSCFDPPLGFEADYEVLIDGRRWLALDLGGQSSFIAASEVEEA